MKITHVLNPAIRLRYITALALTFMSTTCFAMSRIETALVADADGVPCFSIPHKWETRKGIPLYGISVNEPTSVDWQTPAVAYWRFGISPPGDHVLIHPKSCIRYGDLPPNATSRMGAAKALEAFHVYSVTLNARPENSSVSHYGAQFCLKPGAAGKMTVQVVSQDRSDPNRYAVCARP